MKKILPKALTAKYQKLIIDAGNMMDCYETTGIHFMTIKKIIDKGFAKEVQIEKLNKYCEEVETIKA